MHTHNDYCQVDVDRQPHATVIAVTGEVDLFSSRALVDALDTACEHGGPVVVDLTACTFLDSSGLHALLRAHRRAADTGCEVRIARPPASAPARLLEITAPGQLPEHPSRAAALAA